MARIHQIGQKTENEALQWFLNHRLHARLYCRNYRYIGGEIDLIFEECKQEPLGPEETELVFVEVRFRPQLAMVSALESIGPIKRQRMKKTAARFLASYQGKAKQARYDLLLFDGVRWTHLANINLDY